MADDFEQQPLPLGAGESCARRARRAGLTLRQVAGETRIPQRHLQTIEAGDFAALRRAHTRSALPKNYARMVGLDQTRSRRWSAPSSTRGSEPAPVAASFEPGDPARVPSNRVVWVVVVGLLILLAGVFAAYRTIFDPAVELPSLVDAQASQDAAAAAARQRAAAPRPQAAPTGGEVVFTALEPGIWVKFYDADGLQLMQEADGMGERYVVPADAKGPQLWTGRPDALSITIGGRAVPKLAEEQTTMRDVAVSAEALLARPPAPAAAPAPSAAGAPAASPTA
jgi:hypothetical protein